MKLKANPFIFTFIYLFVKSALRTLKPRNVSPFKVTGSSTLKNGWKHSVKNYDRHLLVMGIIHTMQHRPHFLRPLILHLESFPHLRMGIYPFIYRNSGAFSTHEKNEIGIYYFIYCRFSKRTKQQRFAAPKYYTPHLFATEPFQWAKTPRRND